MLMVKMNSEQAADPAEDQYKNVSSHIRFIFESIAEGILEISSDRITFANKAAISLLGVSREQLEGSYLIDYFLLPHRLRVEMMMQKESGGVSEIGRDNPVELNGRQVCMKCLAVPGEEAKTIVFIEDISEQKQMEGQLRQSQKMEAIGTLAGGIAHDFNNILSAIMGYAELSLLEIPQETKLRNKVEQILRASNRAKDLIRQILTFSRQGELKPKPVQLHLIVKEAMKLIRASIPAGIEIRQKIEVDSSHVMADPTQLHQVLMNLCTNAHYAMRDTGGVLEIRLTEHETAETDVSVCPDMNPGAYLRLSIADTGVGIDPALLDRIFEPYFTSKKPGEGTGMGLAVVHGIARRHGGAVTVESRPGQGSRFDVYLPRVMRNTGQSAEESGSLPMGSERILFVDDEEPLVNLGRQMLEHLGYQVECRTSSIEALETFRSNPQHFDLVVTDLAMPNMNGDQLALKIMSIRPGMPILLCTGFSETFTPDKARKMGIQDLLMKPLSLQDLAVGVRQALEHAMHANLSAKSA